MGEPHFARVNADHHSFEEAMDLFAVHPGFPRVQVRMRTRLDEAVRKASSVERLLCTQERLRHITGLFDIRAAAFLNLVSDMPAQNDLVIVLVALVRLAWKEYTGLPLGIFKPGDAKAARDLAAIHARAEYWTTRGYKQLAAAAVAVAARAKKGDKVTDATKERRRARIKTYRKDKDNMTMADFARHVGISLTAIYGMIQGDRKRYSEKKRSILLQKIGVFPSQW